MFARKPIYHLCTTVVQDSEPKVLPSLAFDIKDMDTLISQGKPVSNQNLSNDYYDGTVTNSFDMPFEQHRGVDINDAWNESVGLKKKLSKVKGSKSLLNSMQS